MRAVESHSDSSTAEQPMQPAIPHRVLFVGNSLTGTYDLPAMLQTLARSTGIDSFEAGQVVFDGFSLQDHLTDGSAAEAIASRRWELTILQERSTAGREELRRGVQAFAAIAESAGVDVGVLGVWPPRSLVSSLDESIESSRLAAQDVGAVLFPAGAAWRAAWKMDPLAQLYGPDESAHPSILGTYLAALVVYARLFHRSPLGLPFRFRYGPGNGLYTDISKSDAELLQNAALQAVSSADSVASSNDASTRAGPAARTCSRLNHDPTS